MAHVKGRDREQAVVAGPVRIGSDAVRLQQPTLPGGAVVPARAPGRHGQVRPPVGDAERTQIDMPAEPAVVADQRVRRAGIAVTDDQPVERRRLGQQRQRSADPQRSVLRMPARRVEQARSCSASDLVETYFGAPQVRTPADGRCLVQDAQSFADRGHRCGRVGLPPRGHGHLAGQGCCDDPGTGLVATVFEQLRNGRQGRRPGQAGGLTGKVGPAPGRSPFHEPPPRAVGDLKHHPVGSVLPHRTDIATTGKLQDGQGNQRPWMRRPSRHPNPRIRGT
jgi:hypothetical protein